MVRIHTGQLFCNKPCCVPLICSISLSLCGLSPLSWLDLPPPFDVTRGDSFFNTAQRPLQVMDHHRACTRQGNRLSCGARKPEVNWA